MERFCVYSVIGPKVYLGCCDIFRVFVICNLIIMLKRRLFNY